MAEVPINFDDRPLGHHQPLGVQRPLGDNWFKPLGSHSLAIINLPVNFSADFPIANESEATSTESTVVNAASDSNAPPAAKHRESAASDAERLAVSADAIASEPLENFSGLAPEFNVCPIHTRLAPLEEANSPSADFIARSTAPEVGRATATPSLVTEIFVDDSGQATDLPSPANIELPTTSIASPEDPTNSASESLTTTDQDVTSIPRSVDGDAAFIRGGNTQSAYGLGEELAATDSSAAVSHQASALVQALSAESPPEIARTSEATPSDRSASSPLSRNMDESSHQPLTAESTVIPSIDTVSDIAVLSVSWPESNADAAAADANPPQFNSLARGLEENPASTASATTTANATATVAEKDEVQLPQVESTDPLADAPDIALVPGDREAIAPDITPARAEAVARTSEAALPAAASAETATTDARETLEKVETPLPQTAPLSSPLASALETVVDPIVSPENGSVAETSSIEGGTSLAQASLTRKLEASPPIGEAASAMASALATEVSQSTALSSAVVDVYPSASPVNSGEDRSSSAVQNLASLTPAEDGPVPLGRTSLQATTFANSTEASPFPGEVLASDLAETQTALTAHQTTTLPSETVTRAVDEATELGRTAAESPNQPLAANSTVIPAVDTASDIAALSVSCPDANAGSAAEDANPHQCDSLARALEENPTSTATSITVANTTPTVAENDEPQTSPAEPPHTFLGSLADLEDGAAPTQETLDRQLDAAPVPTSEAAAARAEAFAPEVSQRTTPLPDVVDTYPSESQDVPSDNSSCLEVQDPASSIPAARGPFTPGPDAPIINASDISPAHGGSPPGKWVDSQATLITEGADTPPAIARTSETSTSDGGTSFPPARNSDESSHQQLTADSRVISAADTAPHTDSTVIPSVGTASDPDLPLIPAVDTASDIAVLSVAWPDANVDSPIADATLPQFNSLARALEENPASTVSSITAASATAPVAENDEPQTAPFESSKAVAGSLDAAVGFEGQGAAIAPDIAHARAEAVARTTEVPQPSVAPPGNAVTDCTETLEAAGEPTSQPVSLSVASESPSDTAVSDPAVSALAISADTGVALTSEESTLSAQASLMRKLAASPAPVEEAAAAGDDATATEVSQSAALSSEVIDASPSVSQVGSAEDRSSSAAQNLISSTPAEDDPISPGRTSLQAVPFANPTEASPFLGEVLASDLTETLAALTAQEPATVPAETVARSVDGATETDSTVIVPVLNSYEAGVIDITTPVPLKVDSDRALTATDSSSEACRQAANDAPSNTSDQAPLKAIPTSVELPSPPAIARTSEAASADESAPSSSSARNIDGSSHQPLTANSTVMPAADTAPDTAARVIPAADTTADVAAGPVSWPDANAEPPAAGVNGPQSEYLARALEVDLAPTASPIAAAGATVTNAENDEPHILQGEATAPLADSPDVAVVPGDQGPIAQDTTPTSAETITRTSEATLPAAAAAGNATARTSETLAATATPLPQPVRQPDSLTAAPETAVDSIDRSQDADDDSTSTSEGESSPAQTSLTRKLEAASTTTVEAASPRDDAMATEVSQSAALLSEVVDAYPAASLAGSAEDRAFSAVPDRASSTPTADDLVTSGTTSPIVHTLEMPPVQGGSSLRDLADAQAGLSIAEATTPSSETIARTEDEAIEPGRHAGVSELQSGAASVLNATTAAPAIADVNEDLAANDTSPEVSRQAADVAQSEYLTWAPGANLAPTESPITAASAIGTETKHDEPQTSHFECIDPLADAADNALVLGDKAAIAPDITPARAEAVARTSKVPQQSAETLVNAVTDAADLRTVIAHDTTPASAEALARTSEASLPAVNPAGTAATNSTDISAAAGNSTSQSALFYSPSESSPDTAVSCFAMPGDEGTASSIASGISPAQELLARTFDASAVLPGKSSSASHGPIGTGLNEGTASIPKTVAAQLPEVNARDSADETFPEAEVLATSPPAQDAAIVQETISLQVTSNFNTSNSFLDGNSPSRDFIDMQTAPVIEGTTAAPSEMLARALEETPELKVIARVPAPESASASTFDLATGTPANDSVAGTDLSSEVSRSISEAPAGAIPVNLESPLPQLFRTLGAVPSAAETTSSASPTSAREVADQVPVTEPTVGAAADSLPAFATVPVTYTDINEGSIAAGINTPQPEYLSRALDENSAPPDSPNGISATTNKADATSAHTTEEPVASQIFTASSALVARAVEPLPVDSSGESGQELDLNQPLLDPSLPVIITIAEPLRSQPQPHEMAISPKYEQSFSALGEASVEIGDVNPRQSEWHSEAPSDLNESVSIPASEALQPLQLQRTTAASDDAILSPSQAGGEGQGAESQISSIRVLQPISVIQPLSSRVLNLKPLEKNTAATPQPVNQDQPSQFEPIHNVQSPAEEPFKADAELPNQWHSLTELVASQMAYSRDYSGLTDSEVSQSRPMQADPQSFATPETISANQPENQSYSANDALNLSSGQQESFLSFAPPTSIQAKFSSSTSSLSENAPLCIPASADTPFTTITANTDPSDDLLTFEQLAQETYLRLRQRLVVEQERHGWGYRDRFK